MLYPQIISHCIDDDRMAVDYESVFRSSCVGRGRGLVLRPDTLTKALAASKAAGIETYDSSSSALATPPVRC